MRDGQHTTEACPQRRLLPTLSVLPVLLIAAPAAASDSSAEGGDPAYGEYLSTQCVTCHHAGESAGSIPPIVGLPTMAFVDALLAYKNGERDNQVMRSVTSALGLEEIAALAAYFASVAPD